MSTGTDIHCDLRCKSVLQQHVQQHVSPDDVQVLILSGRRLVARHYWYKSSTDLLLNGPRSEAKMSHSETLRQHACCFSRVDHYSPGKDILLPPHMVHLQYI